MKKLDGFTADIVAERIEELRTVFPEVFKDGKIDFDSLQNILGEHIEDAREKYSFTWAGKLDSIRLAQKRSNGTLRPCKEESVNFDTTQNLYIEGDNLEVLKLLSGSYMNSVKMIYIDPPYNTGNDFVYTDNFSDSIENYKKVIGETAKSNAETAGRYHTNWLNMMLPRLKLARVLLKQDGVIFISIDDNEVTNLRKVCDEVFGEDNFVAQVIWKKKYGLQNDAKWLSVSHDYILVYCKNKESWTPSLLPRTDEAAERYKNPDNDPRGAWKSTDFSRKAIISTCLYDIKIPSGRTIKVPQGRSWLKDATGLAELVKDNRIWFGVNGDSVPSVKRFLSEVKEGMICSTIWDYSEVGHTDKAVKVLNVLMGNVTFDYPKPIDLLQRCVLLANDKNGIYLDFFSGSGTTAHAVMQQNAEDGGNRKFICVQIPELTDEKSEAYKAGYKNICEIGKERIRRAGKSILESISENKKQDIVALTKSIKERGLFEASDRLKIKHEIDTGFKVFKLDTSNLKKWNNEYTRDYEDLALRIKGYYDYLTPDRLPLDMVYEIMLKYSLPLTLPVTEVETAGVTAHIITHIGDETTDPYKVLVCMQEDLTIEQMEALSAQGCDTLFFADRCFTDTNAMTNCDEILKKNQQEMRLF